MDGLTGDSFILQLLCLGGYKDRTIIRSLRFVLVNQRVRIYLPDV